MSSSNNRDLAAAALGVFDVLSHRVLVGIVNGEHKSARVTVTPRSLKQLLDAVDAVHPGAVEAYIRAHKETDW